MKKAFAIILIIFTLSLFPSLAQDAGNEADTPTYETVSSDDKSSDEIFVDEDALSVQPTDPPIQTETAGAFCGHSC